MIPSPTVSDLGSLGKVGGGAALVAAAVDRLRLVTEAAEAEKARAAAELRQTLLQVGRSALDAGDRDALARALYWRHLEIPVGDIVVALGYADQRTLLVAVGPVTIGLGCERCGEPLLARSRSRLGDLQKLATGRSGRHGLRPLCDACDDLRARAEAATWRASSALVLDDDPWDDGHPSGGYESDVVPGVWHGDRDERIDVELDDAERLA